MIDQACQKSTASLSGGSFSRCNAPLNLEFTFLLITSTAKHPCSFAQKKPKNADFFSVVSSVSQLLDITQLNTRLVARKKHPSCFYVSHRSSNRFLIHVISTSLLPHSFPIIAIAFFRYSRCYRNTTQHF